MNVKIVMSARRLVSVRMDVVLTLMVHTTASATKALFPAKTGRAA
jgi:hypothetical protein